jgi:hypothetical protein
MGGDWDAALKAWRVPDARADEARALVEAGAPRRARAKKGQRSPYWRDAYAPVSVIRFSSGAVFTRNKAGRCEDAPCCGCCTI